MDAGDVRQWSDEYLAAFAHAGGTSVRRRRWLAYYGVPLLLTTDDGSFALTSEGQVVAAEGPQIDGTRAAGFGSNEVLDSEVTVLNATSALNRATIAPRRRDGGEISRLTVTYLVTDGPAGRRITVLAVHSPT